MPDANPDTLAVARQFMAALPHARELGLTIIRLGNGHATITMPYDPRLVGDPATGVLHGGAISALMDTASGAAVLSHPAAPVSTATLDLRIDYFRPATPGQAITARADCHHVTRSVAFIRVIATDQDETRPVAMGTGAFTLDRPRPAATGKAPA
ncbi:PaaI family thioesterase [Tabrizicola oligotrophica]|uniref:PaaI family thioesterase n=1 Tax=Tabrizicola oligotrophica TaxID=2710650 RepID=A0A6M0QQH4_9RHOB|nr:PaaI family thioesterase [Tabrizicola oligotrophica]NEY89745.1 PaaI family thioesterase [Tabrizicola oligotrophica]